DRETLAFIAHGLKGLGGNLDAGPLREAAAALEIAAKAGSDDTPALAEPLADVLEATLKELAALENGYAEKGGE
ncbi:MAG: Hpt domain-containing protein, partial [Sulfurisoma sp.]|nr:Hpt domain-containing protein [Sulfurisoma sp.]